MKVHLEHQLISEQKHGKLNNGYMGTRNLALRWSDLAVRLDNQSEYIEGSLEYFINDVIESKIEKCSAHHYYEIFILLEIY